MSYKVAVYRKEHFNAAHRLHNPAWDDATNTKVFGKCNNPHYHGHNYELVVKLTGIPDPATGYVYDMKLLGDLVQEQVTEKLDHKNLNLDVDFLSGKLCSTENLVVEIWKQLQPHLPAHASLHSLKLYETPRIFVEYFGENL